MLRRDWFAELNMVQQEMERLLDDFSRRKPPSYFRFRSWEPAVDVSETENEVIVVAELAGVKHEDLKLEVERNRLQLRGERWEGSNRQKQSCHRLEIYWGPFERVVILPAAVDPGAARANFQDGLLEVVLPKAGTLRVRLDKP